MRGRIIKYQPRNGKPTFGYSFLAGREEKAGSRSRGQARLCQEAEAQEALPKAIEEFENTPANQRAMPTFAEFFRR